MQLNYIMWDIEPELFNLFGISIRYYGLFFVSGFILAVYMLGRIYKKEELSAEDLQKLAVYVMVGMLAGARLGHCLFYEPAYFLAHPLEMLLPIKILPEGGIEFIGYRGLASHGGIIGLFVALIIYSRKTKHTFIDTFDRIGIVAGLSGGFIRLANLMNSEIIGIPTERPWGFVFRQIDNISRHPAQLYEAIAYFFVFAILYILYRKHGEKLKNGFFIGFALVLAFTIRFFIEFVKENQVAFEDGMNYNMGQLLSIPYVIAGIGLMVYGLKKTKKDLKRITNQST